MKPTNLSLTDPCSPRSRIRRSASGAGSRSRELTHLRATSLAQTAEATGCVPTGRGCWFQPGALHGLELEPVIGSAGGATGDRGFKRGAWASAEPSSLSIVTRPIVTLAPALRPANHFDGNASYFDQLGSDIDVMSASLSDFGGRVGNWPYSEDDTYSLAADCATWQSTYDSYGDMPAPSDRFAPMHSLWVSGLAEPVKPNETVVAGIQ